MSKILLVDDEEIERQVLRMFISENMKDVKIVGEADSGKSAVEAFERLNPDIVIMDIKMPGYDGIEAAKRIKRMRDDCVIIFLTAYIEVEKMHECIFAGGEAYLQKPIRKNELIHMINKFKITEKSGKLLSDYKKELIGKILTKNYKASKECLQALLNHIQQSGEGNNLTDIKVTYKDIASDILATLSQLDIKNRENISSDRELMNEIVSTNDNYLLKIWLFKVLDFVFNVIVLDQRGFQDNEINVVLNYLEKNYYKKVTLEEVAEYVNISPFYLSKIFKKCTGINFIDYLTDLKIEKAKELLENTDMPVINIAIELSFNEPNYFTRVFRKISGMTPSNYRETKRGTESGTLKINEAKWYV